MSSGSKKFWSLFEPLYLGARPGYIKCPTSNEVMPRVSSICNYGKFDDVVYQKETCTTFIFREGYVWRMNHAKRASNHERISSKWSGLSGNIDAAYTRNDGSIVFFKNNRWSPGQCPVRVLIMNARKYSVAQIITWAKLMVMQWMDPILSSGTSRTYLLNQVFHFLDTWFTTKTFEESKHPHGSVVSSRTEGKLDWIELTQLWSGMATQEPISSVMTSTGGTTRRQSQLTPDIQRAYLYGVVSRPLWTAHSVGEAERHSSWAAVWSTNSIIIDLLCKN